MSRRALTATLVVTSVTLLATAAPAWAEWQIGENFPDPFCNDPESPDYTSTWFNIWGQPTAEIVFEVWDPDTTGVLVRQDLGEKPPGAYILIWWGTDMIDTVLPEGGYPYRIAVVEGSGPVAFSAWQVAHIQCETPVRECTWGKIKKLYR
jgi:hypothetical protein